MCWFVTLVGIVQVAAGAMYLVRTQLLHSMLSFWAGGKRMYTGAFLSACVGIVFLLAASRCRLSFVVGTVGVIALIKAFLIFFLAGKMTVYIKKLDSAGDRAVRAMALASIGIGALLIYSV